MTEMVKIPCCPKGINDLFHSKGILQKKRRIWYQNLVQNTQKCPKIFWRPEAAGRSRSRTERSSVFTINYHLPISIFEFSMDPTIQPTQIYINIHMLLVSARVCYSYAHAHLINVRTRQFSPLTKPHIISIYFTNEFTLANSAH